jgi:hypothetical protein
MTALETISKSVAARYEDAIECNEDLRGKRATTWTACNEVHVREILMEDWGTVVTADVIEQVVSFLTEEGTEDWEDWPQAFSEDLAEVYWKRCNHYDHEMELIAERRSTLVAQIAALNAELVALGQDAATVKATCETWTNLWDSTEAAACQRARIAAA